jgi:GrpB-like predicted nucleotidyltransferase (UPF0157 family)
VRLVAYDASWPAAFRAEVDRIASRVRAAGLPPLVFEHIGSTAIAGLVAKPILDFMAGHAAGADVPAYVALLAEAGYDPRGPQGVPDRELLVLGDEASRTHHLNLVPAGGAFWHDHLSFRDQLRNDPGLAEAYSTLKRNLASRYTMDRAAYTAGKEAFVRQVVGSR